MTVMALGAIAQSAPDDIPTIKVSVAEKNAQVKSNQAQAKSRYFIMLADEPVALYQGGIKGFKATNVAASNGANGNEEGKLNLNSSASIVYSNYLALKQSETINNITSRLNRDVKVQHSFKVALNSLVLELEPNEALALRKMPGVLGVQKEELQQLLTDVGPQHVGAPSIWDNPEVAGSKGEGLVIGVMDTGIASYQVDIWGKDPSKFIGKPFNPSFADIGGDGYDHENPYGEGNYFGDCLELAEWCNDKLVGVVSYEGFKSISGVGSYYARYDTGQDVHGHGTHVASLPVTLCTTFLIQLFTQAWKELLATNTMTLK